MALPFPIKGYQAIPFPMMNSPSSLSSLSSSSSSSSLLHSYVYMKAHSGKNYIKASIVEGVHVEEQEMSLNTTTLINTQNKIKNKNKTKEETRQNQHQSSHLYEYGIENLPLTYVNFASFSERYKNYNKMERKEYWIPTERTLFIANIPLETITTQRTCRNFLQNLRKVLSAYGEVEGIYLDYSVSSEAICHHLDPLIDTNRHNTSSILASNAYIVFVKSKSVKVALKKCTDFSSIISPEIISSFINDEKSDTIKEIEDDPSKGNLITKLLYKRIEDRPLQEELEEDVDEYMAEFERKEREQEEKRLAMLNGQPDEDGFITVVSNKRKAFTFDKDESRDRERTKFERRVARRAGRGKKKKDNQVLSTFYTHQLKETKKKQLEQLRIRFQEDKIRIQKMKEARTFNPFK